MKQHLTVEQIKELGKDKSILLIKELKMAYSDKWCISSVYHNLSQALTIGKMIEILESSKEEIYCIGKDWRTGGWKYESHNDFRHIRYADKELCDALWQAVKEVL